ncbi:hypothetical protein NLU13_3554 [Sarocladium strictum]|uniref:Zn(2)-C6 fungal-type domain-containing protein n=1 Tax=Sarocladium strictum TaxID=5046 RepID=A0AA39GMY3_SARSR|nr:hypothetical protein NLU13_3554 [Sarocladium strictum]
MIQFAHAWEDPHEPGCNLIPVPMPKMQRATKACFLCRTKKRRCDAKLPICSACDQKRISCTYPPALKRRGAGKAKKRLEALEEKLQKMEARLNEAPAPSESATRTGSVRLEAHQTIGTTPETDSEGLLPFKAIYDHINSLKSSVRHPNSAADAVSPGTLELDPTTLALAARSLPETLGEMPVLDFEDFARKVDADCLNPELDILADTPLFAIRCCAVAVTALGKIANCSFQEMASWAWSSFNGAYKALPQLLLTSTDFRPAQAMTVMAYFASFSADPRLASTLSAIAIRSCEVKRLSVLPDYARETLWAALILETELSLNCDLPSSQSAEDLMLHEHPSATDAKPEVSVFQHRIDLSLILHAIRAYLYSPDALQECPADTLESVEFLASKLRLWRIAMPDELWDELSREPSGEFQDMPGMMLKLTFHHALCMVLWVTRRTHHGGVKAAHNIAEESQRLQGLELRTHVRDLAGLFIDRPPTQFPYFWRTLPFRLSAALTLLMLVIEEPDHPSNATDARVIRTLSTQVAAQNRAGDYDLFNLVQAFQRIAAIAHNAAGTADPRESGLDSDEAQTIRDAFRSVTHPVFVAQDLLTNLRTRDAEKSQIIGHVLGVTISAKDGYSSLVPDCVKPQTFGLA